MTLSDWIKVGTDLSGFAVLAWLIYYVFTGLIPKIMDDFRTALVAQAQEFREAMREQRIDFNKLTESQRIVSIDALRGMSESLKHSHEKMAELHRVSNDKMSDAIAELTVEMARGQRRRTT